MPEVTEDSLYDLIKGNQAQPQEGGIDESNLFNYIQTAQPKTSAAPALKNTLKGAEFFARGGQLNTPQIPIDFAKSSAALLDNTIGSIVPYGAKMASYLFGRTIGDSPEVAEKISSKLASYADKPFGKAFGITNDPTYNAEASGKFMQFVGANLDKGSDWISKQTGLPKDDINWMIQASLPKVVETGGNLVAKGGGKVASQLGSQYELAKQKISPKAEYAAPIEPIEVKGVGATETPKVVAETPKVATEASVEAPKVIESPTRNIEVLPENPPMPTQPLPVEALSNREQILRDVGVENIRRSAVENNPLEASSQYITSKAEKGAYGQGMREQIAHEKEALSNHFNTVETDLGGTVPRKGTGFEVTDEIERGKTIKDALESAQESHKAETTRLYNKASEEVGAVPVELNSLKEYLDKKSNFVHGPEKSLRSGVQDYLKEQGLLEEDGSVKPMTVGQSEQLRKFINKQYNYETSGKIGELVNRIDEDVFSNVKGDTYEQARAHFKAGKEIYDNPKAIKNLLGDEGVNQKIPDEKVMGKISTLDESQFTHLMNTLRDTGKTDAIKEIQTNLVNRIKEAGQSAVNEPWNSIAASKERAKLGNKLRVAFAENPEILDSIDKGIEAGNILHIPNKYPGAAVQTHLLHNKFTEFLISRGAGPAGAYLGGPMGAAAGEWLGQKASNVMDTGRQAKLLQQEIKYNQLNQNKISDFGLKP